MKKTAEWHEARRLGIGGSDANIIMGTDEAAIMRLWKEKRGESEPEDLSWVLPVQIGSVTEELNIRWFEHETGFYVDCRNKMCVHPTIPYMRCELDGVTVTHSGIVAVVEAKHINAFGNPEDAVVKYFPQLHHNMLIAEVTASYLSIFHGTQKYCYFAIGLDPFYAEALLERERQFWECVKSGKPPVDLPPAPEPVLHEAMRSVDMTGNNEWADFAHDWLENKSAASKFDLAAKGLKSIIEPDVKLATGHGITASRSKAGAVTLKKEK